MDYENIVTLTSQAMLMCLVVSLPPVVVAAVVGLLVSFVQAITSIQDQSIGAAAKLVAVVLSVVVAAPWGGAAVLRFAQTAFQAAFV